jgi:hypothetical protein
METNEYVDLGTGWQTDPAIECCSTDPNDPGGGCDCCYNSWTDELKKVTQDYNQINEQSVQLTEHYKFIAAERDKIKVWLDDLVKADQIAKALCSQFEVMESQTDKVCINSKKTVEAIEILFCMIRDLYEQIDKIISIYNEIDNCIKALNSDDLPADSGIRKCLKMYMERVDAVVKTRNDVLKGIMASVEQAIALHEAICSEFGLQKVVEEWHTILNCDEECKDNSGTASAGPCADGQSTTDESTGICVLKPILTLPICNNAHYLWVNEKYQSDVGKADDLANQLIEVNKKKESLSACKNSLDTAIKEIDAQQICK